MGRLHIGAGTLLDNTTNTSVFAGSQHTQIAVFLLGVIDGVGVYLMQHSVNGGLRQVLVIEGVHIIDIYLTQYIREDINTLIHTRSLLPLLSREDGIRNKE